MDTITRVSLLIFVLAFSSLHGSPLPYGPVHGGYHSASIGEDDTSSQMHHHESKATDDTDIQQHEEISLNQENSSQLGYNLNSQKEIKDNVYQVVDKTKEYKEEQDEQVLEKVVFNPESTDQKVTDRNIDVADDRQVLEKVVFNPESTDQKETDRNVDVADDRQVLEKVVFNPESTDQKETDRNVDVADDRQVLETVVFLPHATIKNVGHDLLHIDDANTQLIQSITSLRDSVRKNETKEDHINIHVANKEVTDKGNLDVDSEHKVQAIETLPVIVSVKVEENSNLGVNDTETKPVIQVIEKGVPSIDLNSMQVVPTAVNIPKFDIIDKEKVHVDDQQKVEVIEEGNVNVYLNNKQAVNVTEKKYINADVNAKEVVETIVNIPEVTTKSQSEKGNVNDQRVLETIVNIPLEVATNGPTEKGNVNVYVNDQHAVEVNEKGNVNTDVNEQQVVEKIVYIPEVTTKGPTEKGNVNMYVNDQHAVEVTEKGNVNTDVNDQQVVEKIVYIPEATTKGPTEKGNVNLLVYNQHAVEVTEKGNVNVDVNDKQMVETIVNIPELTTKGPIEKGYVNVYDQQAVEVPEKVNVNMDVNDKKVVETIVNIPEVTTKGPTEKGNVNVSVNDQHAVKVTENANVNIDHNDQQVVEKIVYNSEVTTKGPIEKETVNVYGLHAVEVPEKVIVNIDVNDQQVVEKNVYNSEVTTKGPIEKETVNVYGQHAVEVPEKVIVNIDVNDKKVVETIVNIPEVTTKGPIEKGNVNENVYDQHLVEVTEKGNANIDVNDQKVVEKIVHIPEVTTQRSSETGNVDVGTDRIHLDENRTVKNVEETEVAVKGSSFISMTGKQFIKSILAIPALIFSKVTSKETHVPVKVVDVNTEDEKIIKSDITLSEHYYNKEKKNDDEIEERRDQKEEIITEKINIANIQLHAGNSNYTKNENDDVKVDDSQRHVNGHYGHDHEHGYGHEHHHSHSHATVTQDEIEGQSHIGQHQDTGDHNDQKLEPVNFSNQDERSLIQTDQKRDVKYVTKQNQDTTSSKEVTQSNPKELLGNLNAHVVNTEHKEEASVAGDIHDHEKFEDTVEITKKEESQSQTERENRQLIPVYENQDGQTHLTVSQDIIEGLVHVSPDQAHQQIERNNEKPHENISESSISEKQKFKKTDAPGHFNRYSHDVNNGNSEELGETRNIHYHDNVKAKIDNTEDENVQTQIKIDPHKREISGSNTGLRKGISLKGTHGQQVDRIEVNVEKTVSMKGSE